MKTISVTEKEVQAAFSVAKSEETKQVLTALFRPQEKKVNPTLDDYTTIKTYEDACEALDLAPIYSNFANKDADIGICQYADTQRLWGYLMKLPEHIIALMKLEVISRALWGRNWKPMPDADESKWFYYPYFALWTKDELNDINEKQRDTLLLINACNGVFAGFSYLGTDSRSSLAVATIGFRLCQETEEKAEYFGRQFIELWAEYLKFNFEVGERL